MYDLDGYNVALSLGIIFGDKITVYTWMFSILVEPYSLFTD
jgi:hypothetical protein